MSEADDARTVRRWAAAVVAAWLAPAAPFVVVAGAIERMFRDVGAYPSRAGEVAFLLVDALRTPLGWLVLATFPVALLLPIDAGGSRERVLRWLRRGALLGLVVWACAAVAVFHALAVLSSNGRICLCPPGCPHVGDGRLLVLPLLVVGALQLRAWSGLAGRGASRA